MSRLMRRTLSIRRMLVVVALVAAPSVTFLSPADAQSAARRATPLASKVEYFPDAGAPPALRVRRHRIAMFNGSVQDPSRWVRTAPSRRALSQYGMHSRAMSAAEWVISGDQASEAMRNRIVALGSFPDTRLLAQSGNPRAQYLVGMAFERGLYGARQDLAQRFNGTVVQWT